MTVAAEALFMSPSAASQQLRHLAREVGVELIERRGRRAVLTSAGGVLARFAEEMADLDEEASATMRRLSGTFRGEIRVSGFPSYAGAILPTAVTQLNETYPDLRVIISDLEPFESLRVPPRGDSRSGHRRRSQPGRCAGAGVGRCRLRRARSLRADRNATGCWPPRSGDARVRAMAA